MGWLLTSIPVPSWLGRVAPVPLLGGVRGGLAVDQYSSSPLGFESRRNRDLRLKAIVLIPGFFFNGVQQSLNKTNRNRGSRTLRQKSI